MSRRDKAKELFQIRQKRRQGMTAEDQVMAFSARAGSRKDANKEKLNILTETVFPHNSLNLPEAPTTRFLIKLASRGRKDKLTKVVNDYLTYASNRHPLTILVSLDSDDTDTKRWKHTDPRVVVKRGPHEGKIAAINRDLDGVEFDVLINASDDMWPICQDYDEVIAKDMAIHWPNYDGCLLYYEGSRKDISTLSIMGYNYYKKFNYIYYPQYKSFYCDDEYSMVAKSLNRMKSIEACIIWHFHPDDGLTQIDDNYKTNFANGSKDCDLYHIRRGIIGKDGGMPFDQPPMLLSILIPTMYKRRKHLSHILRRLNDQINKSKYCRQIEIVILSDNGENVVGIKRNVLLEHALGRYIAFVDDDDDVSDKYIDLIMSALEKNPGVDCLSLTGIYTVDDKNPREFIHSLEYSDWIDQPDKFFRCPNHLNTVKTDIARQVCFPEVSFAEDRAYSLKLRGFLSTQAKIDDVLYYYKARTKKDS